MLGLVGCGRQAVEPVEPFPGEAPLVLDGRRFPDAAALERSIVVAGNSANFAALREKLRNRDSIRLAFLGGSITEGAGAAPLSARYSSRLVSQLRTAYPRNPFVEINAGVGATNSRFGCARIGEDVLRQDPDAVFLDFAVNDDASDSARTQEAYEALIRKVLIEAGKPVILVHCVNSQGDSGNHRLETALALHYGLPVVSFREAIWPVVSKRFGIWQTLFVDVVHPNSTGHAVLAELLFNSFTRLLWSSEAGDDKPAGGFDDIPSPLTSDFYTRSRFFHQQDSTLFSLRVGEWGPLSDPHGRLGYEAKTPHKSLDMAVSVREMTVAYRVSARLQSRMQITLDGIPLDTLSNHFAEHWGGGYLRLFTIFRQETPEPRRIGLTMIEGGSFPVEYFLPVD